MVQELLNLWEHDWQKLASLETPKVFPYSKSQMPLNGPALHREHFTPCCVYVHVFNSDLGSISCLKLSIFRGKGLWDDEKLT